MQTLRANLQTEQKLVTRIKACSGDSLKLEEELQFCREHNTQMQAKVQDTHAEMLHQQEIIEDKLEKILEEKAAVEEENNSLCQDIKNKDEIIKQLTRENLTVNSNLTQVQQLLCADEDQQARISELERRLREQADVKVSVQVRFENCSTLLLEVEEKLQETQTISMQLMKRCKNKDEEIDRLSAEMENIQSNVEDKLFIYKPLHNDPVDQNLANYINKAPLRLRSKMHFEREAPGIYRFARKKVFMKIEGETIVIRVGGGFLTIQEFVALNCGAKESSEQDKKRITNLVYAGKCAGNKEFKTFYMSQHTLDEVENPEDSENAPDHQFTVEKRSKSVLTGSKVSKHTASKSIPSTPQGNYT